MSEEQRNSSITNESQGREEKAAASGEKTLSPQVVISLILLLLFAVFAMVNTQEISINFLITNVDAPLILVLLGSFILGAITAALTGWHSRRKKKRK